MQQDLSEKKRMTMWSLLSFSRTRLCLHIETTIATAFMMLYKYLLKNNQQSPYNLFTLLVSSLFTACKMTESLRSMQQVYSEILRSCNFSIKQMGAEYLTTVMCRKDFEDRQMTNEEILEVNMCELDLHEALNFQMEIDLPFKYIEKNVKPYITNEIYPALVKICCLFLCSNNITDIPPAVIAVTATQIVFKNREIPENILNWTKDLQKEYDSSLFERATATYELQVQMLSHKNKQKKPE